MELKTGLIVLLLMVATQSGYPEGEKKELGLPEAIETALSSYPNLKRLRAQTQESSARLLRARSASGLQSGLSFRFQRQGPLVEFPVPPAGRVKVVREEVLTGSVTAQQLLFDGGRTRANRRVAEMGVDVSREQLRDAERLLIRDVKRAYYSLLKMEALRQVSEEMESLANEQLRVARLRFAEGASPRFDVTRSEVEAANARQEFVTSRKTVDLARAALNHILSRPVNGDLDLKPVTDNVTAPDDDATLKRLTELALENRSELKIARNQAGISRQSVRAAVAERMPQVSLTAAYNRQTATAFQENFNWFAGVGVSFSLFDGGRARSMIREAHASRDSAEATVAQARQLIELEVKQAHLVVRESYQRIETTAATVRSARENLEIARLRYTNGVGINLEVMDAQLALSRSLAQNVNAYYDYWVARADLDAAVGRTGS